MGANAGRRPPLVILALDAGDAPWLERWAREGRLPTIASVMARGCWGRTGGPELICEHGTWISLFGGVSRAEHGYHYFRQLVPGSYDLRTVTGRDVGVPPFWGRLVGRDMRVAVIDVPDTLPIPGLSGVQLANWAVHNAPLPPSAEPGEVLDEARRAVGPATTIAEKLYSSADDDRRLYRALLDRVGRKGELCRRLLAGGDFDLVVLAFGECHTGSHQFWKYRPEAREFGAALPEGELMHAIRTLYEETDRQFGLVLGQLPADANVVVVSSTGMKAQYPTTGLSEALCRRLGYQASPPAGGAKRSLRPLDVARRILPEPVRVALSRRLSREARERLLADQFRGATDWARTTAFAIPSAYTSFIRVNLRGREPQGTVAPGAEYEALLARLEADLRLLVDPRTGAPAVRGVVRTVDLFGGGAPRVLPDLLAEWQPAAHFLDRVVHPRAELTQERPEFFRDSDHSQAGFVAAAGPSVRAAGAIGEISVLDLAPTFLAMLGQPNEGVGSGRVVETMCDGRAAAR